MTRKHKSQVYDQNGSSVHGQFLVSMAPQKPGAILLKIALNDGSVLDQFFGFHGCTKNMAPFMLEMTLK